jgi:hypothetical protein
MLLLLTLIPKLTLLSALLVQIDRTPTMAAISFLVVEAEEGKLLMVTYHTLNLAKSPSVKFATDWVK